MRAACRAARRSGQRLGFVPTMGALHEGHLSLVRAAKAACDIVAASIFVNPTQFGPNEDLARYPRDFDRDRNLLAKEGVELLFAPSVEEMYPAGAVTWVTVEGLSGKLDGRSRPGHFRGVTTVVAKLFHIVEPDAAFFGQKDAAQLAIIRRMVRDLKFPVEIVAGAIVREADGLAMSSRNGYLDSRAAATGAGAASCADESEKVVGSRRARCGKACSCRSRRNCRRKICAPRLLRDRRPREPRSSQEPRRRRAGRGGGIRGNNAASRQYFASEMPLTNAADERRQKLAARLPMRRKKEPADRAPACHAPWFRFAPRGEDRIRSACGRE